MTVWEESKNNSPDRSVYLMSKGYEGDMEGQMSERQQ